MGSNLYLITIRILLELIAKGLIWGSLGLLFREPAMASRSMFMANKNEVLAIMEVCKLNK